MHWNLVWVILFRMEDLARLAIENLNVRYLAWKEEPDPTKWASLLRKKASFSEKRASAVIAGEKLTDAERASLAEAFNVEIEVMITTALFGLSEKEIRMENIKYLFRELPQGNQKKIAQILEIREETVSRWVTGKNPPSTTNARRLLEAIGIDPSADVNQVPFFLSLSPMGQLAQKRWLIERIEKISPVELSKLFPALEKIFRQNEDY